MRHCAKVGISNSVLSNPLASCSPHISTPLPPGSFSQSPQPLGPSLFLTTCSQSSSKLIGTASKTSFQSSHFSVPALSSVSLGGLLTGLAPWQRFFLATATRHIWKTAHLTTSLPPLKSSAAFHQIQNKIKTPRHKMCHLLSPPPHPGSVSPSPTSTPTQMLSCACMTQGHRCAPPCLKSPPSSVSPQGGALLSLRTLLSRHFLYISGTSWLHHRLKALDTHRLCDRGCPTC